MNPDWANEHLQVIRTLMERSALYRRALAPIMFTVGGVGIVAAVVGGLLRIDRRPYFVLFWFGIGIVMLAASFFLVRRQAVAAGEPFWSPPTRRIAQAMLPALYAGVALSGIALFVTEPGGRGMANLIIVPIWAVLYGCALHAAGFFMPRGIRLLGWLFVLFGTLAELKLFFALPGPPSPMFSPNLLMGLSFGGLHLAYGIYLNFTEKRKHDA